MKNMPSVKVSAGIHIIAANIVSFDYFRPLLRDLTLVYIYSSTGLCHRDVWGGLLYKLAQREI